MSRILIVDDSALSRRILRRILEGAGYAVAEAEDGMSAIERYYLDTPDLVLLDLTMVGMPGLDVLEKLRAINPRVPVLIASADIQRSTKALADEAGARGFLNKPFTPEDVLRAVQAALVGDAV